MSLVQGIVLGASFCCTVGPQSLFVLRQGVRGEAALLAALLCTLSDFGLIAIAVAGAHTVAGAIPEAEGIAAWAAGAFMLAYGCATLAAAARRNAAPSDLPRAAASLAIAGAALAISLLNPQVYLEVLVAVGLAGLHYPAEERWLFGLGVALVSPLWFFGLVLLGRRIAPFASRPSVGLVMDIGGGLAMIGVAAAIFWSAIAAA